jgi:IS30 family transposase
MGAAVQQIADWLEKLGMSEYAQRFAENGINDRRVMLTAISKLAGAASATPESRRNRGQRGYRFKQAEATAHARQAIRSKPSKLTAPIRREIEAKSRQMRWSPEQISGWLSAFALHRSGKDGATSSIWRTPHWAG